MKLIVKQYEEKYLDETVKIWNDVVIEGHAFPQLDLLDQASRNIFFTSQTHTGLVIDEMTDEVKGLYILHPNNIGRCGHIANASYAVSKNYRGMHIGELLMNDCLKEARAHHFKILQFNAVVKSNIAANKLYEKIGFTVLGTIPGGFYNKEGNYEDIVLYYITL